MATIWLLLHVGKRWSGREGKNKRTDHCQGPPISQTPSRPTQVPHFHDVTICSTAAEENPWVSSCVLAACGFAAWAKSHVSTCSTTLSYWLSPRMTGVGGGGNKVQALGRREWGKVEIPKWKINTNDSGRSDEREFHSRRFRALPLLSGLG